MEKVKTKVRFTSLDVAAMVQNLQRLIGMRATNIYDLNPSTYIIKVSKSEEKALILIENGVRFHTVDQKTDKKDIPSGFTMKFRKFLRSKRLQGVRQVGVERVVVFTFGTQAYTNHLILQLYAQGNIILTDADYKILQCIRSHEFNDKVKTAVGQIYPFEHAANIYLENIDIKTTKIQEILFQATEKVDNQANQAENKKKKKGGQKKQGTKLRDIVFKLIPCLFPAVIDNILIGQKMDPDQTVSQQNIQTIEEGCKVCYKFLKDFLKLKHVGFLYSKKQVADKEDKQYFQFSPYKNIKFEQSYAQFKHDSFDSAVSEYFSKYKKSQHQEQQQFEELAWKKYQQIKKDQQNRVKKLQEEQDIYKVKAEYIQKNLHDVEAIIKIIKTMQDNGYSWDAIQRMVLESKKNGDPLANMIHELHINKRQVSVLLGDPSSEQQHFDLLPVQINIDYNAYTNATMYYESKKKNYQKQLRTKEASQQVLKIAEKDALKIIERKKNQQFSKSIPTRKQFWFQKFYWFISSEGVLVISGRDSHQNQLIVKRYMKPGDLYMHSDYGGAASTVIKINSKQVGVPRTTLEQAAIFTVCRSKAWDTKILSGAWWVHHDQVSKSAPTGEFLPTGSFMIRGKRNFIQPNRMEMGITFLFKIDQQSAKRHMNDRKIHQQQLEQDKQKIAQETSATEKTQEAQQFAIISVQANTKQKGPKNQQKGANKQQNQPQLKKQQSKKQAPTQKQQSQEQDSDDDNSNEDGQQQKGKQQNKKQSKQTNDKKKIQQGQQQQVKPKMRNKRKLKKLQKYLEQQDEEERQIIMKMIGARQMKHRQDEEEQEVQKVQKNKGKDKNKKKGIDKYIGSQKNDEVSEKLNPDKVLFFKKKGQQNEPSESSDSSEQQKKQQKKVQSEIKQQIQEKKQSQEKNPVEGQNIEQKQQANQENDQSSGEQQPQKDQKPEGKVEQKKEEDQQVDEKALNSEIAELFKLVGKAHPEDKIENLVAMCAPYNSMKDNRFKIKLVPGGLKKGKAARNILHYFVNSSDLTEIEKPLVKTIPQQQIINSLIGNVKLAGAGLLKLEQKQKAEKKTKKKENQKKQKNG